MSGNLQVNEVAPSTSQEAPAAPRKFGQGYQSELGVEQAAESARVEREAAVSLPPRAAEPAPKVIAPELNYANLQTAPIDEQTSSAKKAIEEFQTSTMLSAKSLRRGLAANLEKDQKQLKAWATGIHPATWFAGGLRDGLQKSIASETEYLQATDKKIEALEQRTALSQSMLQSAEELQKRALAEGNTAAAQRMKGVARDLLAQAPMVLSMSEEYFNQAADGLKSVTESLKTSNAPTQTAIEQVRAASDVVQDWQKNGFDPSSGRLRTVSAMADTKKLNESYNKIREDFVKADAQLADWEERCKMGGVVGVGICAVVLSGPVGVAYLGAFLGWGAGAAVGIGLGTLCGSGLSFAQEGLGVAFGNKQSIDGGKIWNDTKGYAWTAGTSVLFAKAMNVIGFVGGAMQGIVNSGCAKVGSVFTGSRAGQYVLGIPVLGRTLSATGQFIARGFSLMTGVGTAGALAGGPVGGMSYLEGLNQQQQVREQFEHQAGENADLKALMENDPAEFHRQMRSYMHSQSVSDADIIVRSLQNAGVASISSFLHSRFPGSSKIGTRLWQEAGKHGAAIGAGVASEYVKNMPELNGFGLQDRETISNSDLVRFTVSSVLGHASGAGEVSGMRIFKPLPKPAAGTGTPAPKVRLPRVT